MRISNPRSFAGDKALATREFVTSTSVNLKETLSGTITDNYNTLSGAIKNINNSYAWINAGPVNNPEGKKIDPSLLPPLAIINTVKKPLDEIITEAGSITETNGDHLMNSWFENNKNDYQDGDLIIVGNAENMTNYQELKSALGPWIVTKNKENDNLILIKLAFPTTDILTVNNIEPDTNTGNLTLQLVDVLKQKNNITSDRVEQLSSIIYNLEIDENNRFGIYTYVGNTNLAFVGYAKYDELKSVSGDVLINTEDIRKIKEDISAHENELATINGKLGTISGNLADVKTWAVGIEPYDVTFTKELVSEEIFGDSGINYNLDTGENLYTANIASLDASTQVLSLTENGIPIYPDLFFNADGLNIVLISTETTDTLSGTYKLYVLNTVDSIISNPKHRL
jgi:hypothetical protein